MDKFFNKVFRVADDGFGWVDSECFCIPENVKMTVQRPYTLIQPPNPNWKPYFDWESETWIETATEEEMHIGEDLLDPYELLKQQALIIKKLQAERNED